MRSARQLHVPEPQSPPTEPAPASEAQPAAEEIRPFERKAHAYARERGISRRLYAFVRFLATAVLRGWFRVRVSGIEHIPAEGPVIVAPNHKNFLDAFFIGIATRRHVRYMAKVELFKGPLARLFPRLGAFPVRRGEADEDALETARAILLAGGVVVVFPEGTRVEQPDALGSPHHGAGRLALETGAPIIPAAITGTSHLWRGALPKVRRVQLTFLPPVLPEARPGRDVVSELIDERVWPAVQDEYGRLRAKPGLIAAGLAAIGIGAGLLARRQLDARRKPRLLGKVEPRKLRRRNARDRLRARLHSLR
ncbi:MAG: lysophospholipid acyltransferase family protein [Solirubrobacteraceae bacterium]